MAARRGKTQAKRNSGGDSGLPGWAWMVLGILLAVVAILVAPKYLKSGGDGFFRPQANPDAQPAPVASADEEPIASDEDKPAKKPAEADKKDTDYDFYTLLPGKEVPMSDAELAASERAEAKRAAQQKAPEPAATTPATASTEPAPATTPALPKPVDTATASPAPTTAAPSPTAPASATPAATASAPVDDGTRYLLQAGAFQASGQAEEMKAKIAMMGVSARVESASIGGKTVYRVRMGPYGTASDLADAKRKLSAGGLPAMAIKVK